MSMNILVNVLTHGVSLTLLLSGRCKIGTTTQTDWYFFSHKDKKYPSGTRNNRATSAGFRKATGRDKVIYSSNSIIGMRKTLVFYTGRAPHGLKSDWICRICKKRNHQQKGRFGDYVAEAKMVKGWDDLSESNNIRKWAAVDQLVACELNGETGDEQQGCLGSNLSCDDQLQTQSFYEICSLWDFT